MNLKKIWDGLTEKKFEPPKMLFKGEEHFVLFVPEVPKVIIELEQNVAQEVGHEFKGAPLVYVIFRKGEDTEAFCFQKDVRLEIADFISNTEKLREYCKSHKSDLVPSCYARVSEETESPVEKVKMGFGNVELKAA